MEVREDDWHVAAEFPDYLAADSAWRRELLGIDDDCDAFEMLLAARDAFPNRDTFGADG